jgi:dolichol-phosphate mannosyltransferase
MDRLPLLSVVVPCYNEEACLTACYRRLTAVMTEIGSPYELVFVDDGSKDATQRMLEALHEADPRVVVLSLSRNFGHQPAVTAGMEAARVVIIDSDLQDPPELIPKMLELWRQNYQVVYGVRMDRDGESKFKLLTAKHFYRTLNWLSDVEIPLDAGDFRLLDRSVVDAFGQMPERHRLLRAMSSWIGFNQIGLPYERANRVAGTTKYPLAKMMALATDGIVSFSTVPLKFVTAIGFVAATASFLGIVYTLIVRLFTRSWVPGWAISFIGMLLMSGLQLLCLGVLGEYVGRIYTESKQRPLYLLKQKLQATMMVPDAGEQESSLD